MKEYDVLFIHPHRITKDDFEYPLFPMGFLPMASLLSEDCDVRIVNLALEAALSGNRFDVKSYLKNWKFKIAAIDLHWWVHSYDSIQLAKLCKEVNPHSFTVLGGYTASFFAREILERFPFIDVVIKGDGEVPLAELAKNHLKGESVKTVKNSVVRENGRIYENPISYVPDSLDHLTFTDVHLLENWEEHLWLFTKPSKYDPLRADTVFNPWLCIARGCTFNCSFCGGTKEAQWLCAGRTGISLRSPQKVVEDVSYLESIGVRSIEFSHGPAIVGEKHFGEILHLLRKEQVDVKGSMELWQMPSVDFLGGLEKSFSNLMFRIILGSGSEEVRQFNRGISTSNKAVLKFLDYCLALGIASHILFSSNLPLESKESFKESLVLMENLVKKGITSISCGNHSLEPASPIFLNPKGYRVISGIHCFTDYYSLLKKRQKHYNPSGYHTETLSQQDSMALIETMNEKYSQLIETLNMRPIEYSFY